MARVGRGRSRGGRIIDIPQPNIPLRGTGKTMIGRGTTILDPGQFDEPLENPKLVGCSPTDHEVDAKKHLKEQLTDIMLHNRGSVIHMSLKYFSCSSDVEFYIDKVMDSLLRSPLLIEKFTMSYKLITLLKSHGEKVKLAMFSKLQSTFQDMKVLMKDYSSLNASEREGVRNFCDLLGQFYFRFRTAIDPPERYTILSVPVLECMTYLAKVRGRHELKLLAKLIVYNLSALNKLTEHQDKLSELWVQILQAFFDGVEDNKEMGWLLCSLQLLSRERSCLPAKVDEFYASALEEGWAELPKSRAQMLADIPPDVVGTHLDKFDVNLDEYTRNRFVSL